MGRILKVTSPSELDTRITLQYKTRVSDGMGSFIETWTDAATVWAKKTQHRSNEAVQAMMTTGFAVFNYRLHFRPDVKSSWRIKDGNSYLNIIGPPVVDDRHRYMDITAMEAK